MSRRLFISYSHADAALLDELSTHLRPLERSGLIKPWTDRFILAGDHIDRDVKEALKTADIIALLVSPSFLASDYCYEKEMEEAVARHQRGEARVIPIIARPCQWEETPFGRLRGTPTDNRPIMSRAWPDKDEAWNIVARDIAMAARSSPVAEPAIEASASSERQPASQMRPRLEAPRVGAATDRDKDLFLKACFQMIADEFEAGISALTGGLSGDFERLDTRRFTATIYQDGSKVAGCTIWSGGQHLQRAVCYHGQDDGETRSMNEYVIVELGDSGLCLRPVMSMTASKEMDAFAVAQHFWKRFTEPLARRTW